MRPSNLIGPADRERIEAAVRAAEAGTSGEIVVQVVRRSEDFAVSPWRFAVLLAALVLLAADWIAPASSLLVLFGLQAAAVFVAHAACILDPIRRLCLRAKANCGRPNMAKIKRQKVANRSNTVRPFSVPNRKFLCSTGLSPSTNIVIGYHHKDNKVLSLFCDRLGFTSL